VRADRYPPRRVLPDDYLGELTTTALAVQMSKAMHLGRSSSQAKGILMGECRCSAEEAVAVLAKIFQHANRKLRDVAAALIEQARP